MCDGGSNSRPGQHPGEAIPACVVTDLWDSVGIPQPHQLLLDLGFKDEHVKLNSLLDCMEEEIFSISSNFQNISNWSSSLILFRAALCLYRYEIDNVKILLNQTVAERNKLKIDLSDANRRASILAHDVDENHLKLEAASKSRLKILEQKHCETIQQLTMRLDAEKDQTGRVVSELEKRVASLQNEETKLKNQFEILKIKHEKVEKENENLQEQLSETLETNKKFTLEIKMLTDQQNRLRECREVTDTSNFEDQIKALKKEIITLRDKNDELSFELEQINLKFSQKSDENVIELSPSNLDPENNFTKNITEECEMLLDKSSSGSNGIKRRGISPTTSNYELVNEEESPRICKVRKCNNVYAEKESLLQNCSSINTPVCDIQRFKECAIDIFDNMPYDKNLSNTMTLNEKSDTCCLSTNTLENILQHIKDQNLFILLDIVNQSNHKYFYLLFYYLLHEIKNDLTQISIDESLFANNSRKIDDLTKLRLCLNEMIKLKLECEQQTPNNDIELSNSDNLKNSTENIFSLDEIHIHEKELISQLKSQTIELEKILEKERSDKNKEIEKCRELEANLESLRNLYDESEDYWASKLKDERDIFEQEQQINDDKFSDLMNKVAEYEEQFANKNDFSRMPLSTIEEKCMLEKQFTDLEEEFQEYKSKMDTEINEKDLEIKSLNEKILALEKSNQENIESNKLNVFQNTMKSNDKCNVPNIESSIDITDCNNPIISPIEYLWNQKTISSPLNNKLNSQKVRDYQNPTFLKDQISKNNFNIFVENSNEGNENLNVNFEVPPNNSDMSASNKAESVKLLPSKNNMNCNFNNVFQKKILHCADLEQALQGRQKQTQGPEEFQNSIKTEMNSFQSRLSPHQEESSARAMLEFQYHSALLQQQAYAEAVIQQTTALYKSEIGALRQKLATADLLIRDLYVENCHLSRNINPPIL